MAPRVDQIRYVGAGEKSPYTYYPVLIIGAGESGIAMGCRLRQVLGCDQFRIFERKSALGGTWYANQYPGIACDVPALMYSFSFAQNPFWTSLFPSGKEIVRYLYDVCARFQILDKIQLDTNVKSIVWKDNDEEWEVVLEVLAPGIGDLPSKKRKAVEEERGIQAVVLRTETVRAKVVVSAVGGLVEPKPPLNVPGIDKFEGEILHTANWNPDIDLKDKNVVVIGTGCSAGQVIPQLVKPQYGAKHVTQLLRSPPWAVPFVSPVARKTWEKWVPRLSQYVPGFQYTLRKMFFALLELEFVLLFTPSEAARQRRAEKAKELIAYLKNTVPEEYHEILIPDYEVFCKRRIVDEGWFKSLQDPRIEITSLPLTSASAKTVTLGPGRLYPPMSKTDSTAPTDERTIPADVLVMANGYETNQWLHPLDVTGRNGQSLYETWDARGGAQAYLGLAMDGFPNFFLIFGPNTATGHSSVILASENMVNYSLKFIKSILSGEVSTWEVTEKAERDWTNEIQRLLRNSVFMSGCTNWYVSKDGWNATTYPRTQIDYTIRCMFPVWSHWNAEYTRKGLIRLRLRQIFKAFAVLGSLAGLIYTVQYGTAASKDVLKDLLARVRGGLRWGFDVARARV